MIVKCIVENQSGPDVGRCYVVYSLFVTDSGVRFYLLCEGGNRCPSWYHEALFEVVDPTPAGCWITFWVDGTTTVCEKGKLYTFPEFSENGCDFHINLIEGCRRDEQIFRSYVAKMKDEAIS